MKKKFFAILLTLTMIFTLAGCGETKPANAATEPSQNTSDVEPNPVTEPEPTTEPEPEPTIETSQHAHSAFTYDDTGLTPFQKSLYDESIAALEYVTERGWYVVSLNLGGLDYCKIDSPSDLLAVTILRDETDTTKSGVGSWVWTRGTWHVNFNSVGYEYQNIDVLFGTLFNTVVEACKVPDK